MTLLFRLVNQIAFISNYFIQSNNNEYSGFKDCQPILLSDLNIKKKLGEGYFGIVYQAQYMVSRVFYLVSEV